MQRKFKTHTIYYWKKILEKLKKNWVNIKKKIDTNFRKSKMNNEQKFQE